MWSTPTNTPQKPFFDFDKFKIFTVVIIILILIRMIYMYFTRRNSYERIIKVKYISSQGYNLKIIDIDGIVYTASLVSKSINRRSIVDMTVGNTYRVQLYGLNNILSAKLISQP
jgi:hypothetical protein